MRDLVNKLRKVEMLKSGREMKEKKVDRLKNWMRDVMKSEGEVTVRGDARWMRAEFQITHC